ncbi:MAG: glycosyltransferase family 39 protein, partial [Gemmatimonadales bacterium]|nr:glycosyltransferase family 39 protein [Gemmatimonadales bacterium]
MESIEERLSRFSLRHVALGAAVTSLLVAAWLAVEYREMGGPGDQLEYFEQAAHLVPFVHHYYGPGYFFALRLVHMALPMDWFSAGKVLALLSLGAYLLACNALFGRLLGDRARWLALIVLVLTPEVISGGYEVSTNMYAAASVIAAIWLMTRAPIEGNRDWLLAGLLFGFAYLTRFASAGYIVGALAGVWLL